jgi:DNA-binding CsgD family transcriptional regulator
VSDLTSSDISDKNEGISISPSEPSEFISRLSGNDAVTLLEIIHQSISCHTEEDFVNLFPKIQELFPYDFAGVLLGFNDNNKGPVVVPGVNISFPEEWMHEYFSRNYHKVSALTIQNFATYKPQYMTDTWEKLRQPKEIKSLCLDFGIREGYAHGACPSARGENGSMFCFSGLSMEYSRHTEAILELIVPHLHFALTHVYRNRKPDINKDVLSTREKEVLNWLKQGKSSWEISVILNISERTVNYHVYNIMQKLEVVNRPQALAVAVRLGLIEIE